MAARGKGRWRWCGNRRKELKDYGKYEEEGDMEVGKYEEEGDEEGGQIGRRRRWMKKEI